MGLKILKPPSKNTITVNGRCTKYRLKNCPLLVGSGKRRYQSFIKFDIGALQASLDIVSAILKLYLFENDCPNTSKIIFVHQVLSPCRKGKYLAIKPQPAAGAAIDKKNKTFISFDITPLFIDWYIGASANQGILLNLPHEMCPCLLSFHSKEFCDSQFWPFLEITYRDPRPPEKSCCQTLDFNASVITDDLVQTAATLDVQAFNYTYYIINTGSNNAIISLQLSPDGTNWLTDEPLQVIAPGGILPFVPNIIASFARLTYQSAASGRHTSLDIRVRGFSS